MGMEWTAAEPLSRTIVIEAHGENVDEIEMCALDQARECFGLDVRLEVKRNYHVTRRDRHVSGKRYHAHVVVSEVLT